jgi:ATP-dependent helicase/nuclease subunit B
MQYQQTVPRVFNIPADVAFLPSLARAILAGGFPLANMEPPGAIELSQWTILLPTRRAARALATAFLTAGNGRATILPRIRPIGDVDEDEFVFSAPQEDGPSSQIPPAVPEPQLLFLLARLIAQWLDSNAKGELARALIGHTGRVFGLARSLIELIDSFDTEEVSLDALQSLLGPDFAAHRQTMLDFLNIIRIRLPQELDAAGLVSRARRRSLLLRAEARRLASGPYPQPIIAAGSTGTIPATANLLKAISGLPRGAVVVPGLDQVMDEESWQAALVEESHPQHSLNRLLGTLGVSREDVLPLPGIVEQRPGLPRLWLASELMRPVATSDRWKTTVAASDAILPRALAGLEVIEAPDDTTEALVVALIMRSVLERRSATASLVTPDRKLARRVQSELARWGIEIADSAGEPSAHQPEGIFIRLIAELGVSRLGMRELAALLKHPLFGLGRTRAEAASLIERAEIALLRGPPPPAGLQSLLQRCAMARAAAAAGEEARRRPHPAVRRLTADDWSQLHHFIADLKVAVSAFMAMTETNVPRPLRHYLHSHLGLADVLAASPGETNVLWRGQSGEVLAELFADLLAHADRAPNLTPADYLALLVDELEAHPVRFPETGHPRLAILGLLEARLIKSDVTVLAGLNQGLWPPEPRIDPWLSRPMREKIGLSQSERRIGLAAHDFIQSFAAGEVYLTCARKIDGEPAVPSRFFLRLAALAAASGHRLGAGSSHWIHWAASIDNRLPAANIAPAMPAPPVHLRPKKLSVTRIVALIENPYRIFAENILSLQELDPIARPLGAAERGSTVHEALRRYCEAADACGGSECGISLSECCREAFVRIAGEVPMLRLWWPRFIRMAEWFIEHDRELRNTAQRRHFEIPASTSLLIAGEEFIITARADRIDVLEQGNLRIIDYKTGELPSYDEVAAGLNPQMALEAWLAAEGAFTGIASREVSELIYLQLSGGVVPGTLRPAHGEISATSLAHQAAAGLKSLLCEYSRSATPYLALVDRGGAGRGSISHLARADEWRLSQ